MPDLTALDAAEPWRRRAACRGVDDPEIFHATSGAGSDLRPREAAHAQRHAAAICWSGADGSECPVRLNCLAFALETGQHTGIWGGLTAAERWRFKRDARAGVVSWPSREVHA